ncbi:MAG: hypothetical protein IPP71_08905 [Bacteroidetes bacterium]|nr:hypothetical protein [Bacteroidota bacterium]
MAKPSALDQGLWSGLFNIKRLKQLGTTAQTLTLTGTAIVNLVRCRFNGNLTLSAGGFLLKMTFLTVLPLYKSRNSKLP